MVDFLTGRMTVEAKPEAATKMATAPTVAPLAQREQDPAAAAVLAVLARARDSVRQGKRVRGHGLVPLFRALEGPDSEVGVSLPS